MGDQDGSMIVTLRDVYQLLQVTNHQQAEVISEMKLLASKAQTTDTRTQDMEERIRQLERRVWAIPSLAAVLSTVSLAVAVINVLK